MYHLACGFVFPMILIGTLETNMKKESKITVLVMLSVLFLVQILMVVGE